MSVTMPDFIKVKLLKSIVYGDGVWPKGYILNVSPSYAEELIADGKAEVLQEETPKAAKAPKENK